MIEYVPNPKDPESGVRFSRLVSWLEKVLHKEVHNVTRVSGDASFRKYYRVLTDNGPMIAMDTSIEKASLQPYLRIARAWQKGGLNVPEIVSVDEGMGFVLVSDLGGRHYLDELNDQTADALYLHAMEALVTLQTLEMDDGLPAYGEKLLREETQLFADWFLERHLGIDCTHGSLRMLLCEVEELLLESACSQPQVRVHRDYHSRNLMVCDPSTPGLLDFQDAVTGPLTYDLVSLLRDCYIQWPHEKVTGWAKWFFHAREAHTGQTISWNRFNHWFDLMGIHRHMKAIGIFSRLNYRDGKENYLPEIPRTFSYLLDVSSRFPALSELHRFLRDTVVPAVERIKTARTCDNGSGFHD